MEATGSPVLLHQTVTVNGLNMHYVEAGEGPPVVLLHGFPETWFAWRHQVSVLAENFRVIAPDLRGCGATEKPSSGYDKRTMARDVLELMHHLGIRRAPLVGHDRGALVATRFAKDHPHALERLVVIDTLPTATASGKRDTKQTRGDLNLSSDPPSKLRDTSFAGREEAWLRSHFSSWCHHPDSVTSDEIATYLESFGGADALSGPLGDLRAAEEDLLQDGKDLGAKITCPLLAIWGEDSRAVATAENFREVWHHFATRPEFLSIPQCGHFPHEEKPEAVNRALTRFLSPWLRSAGTEAFFRGAPEPAAQPVETSATAR